MARGSGRPSWWRLSIGEIAACGAIALALGVWAMRADEDSAVGRLLDRAESALAATDGDDSPRDRRRYGPRWRAISAMNADDLGTLEEMCDQWPEDRRVWFYRALVELRRGMHERSIVSNRRVIDLAPGRDTALNARYNIACAHALRGDPEAAVAALRDAVDAGYRQVRHTLTDPDLASLRDREDFARVVREMRRRLEQRIGDPDDR